MIRFERDFANAGERFRPFGDGGEVTLVVVDAGNQRAAQNDRRPCAIQFAEILENQRIVPPGQLPVAFRVGRFEVVEEEVRQRQELAVFAPRRVAAGVERGGDALRLRAGQQFPGELELRHRFAAGERQSAAGFAVEDQVPQDFGHHRGDIHFAPGHFERARRTPGSAAAAADAVFPVEQMRAVLHAVAVLRAERQAEPAADAFLRRET
ncbi:hypothetical protein SDC9_149979 [bioreactor metagenome]|uniref:Uncharacterized protein n=1 Tax=bioreactor metagenome TaxID=1076179 RepID=A0A645EQF6_9ZZZZ